MRMALIGLGKMGGNMARRLRRNGVDSVGYDRTTDVVALLDVGGGDSQAFRTHLFQPDVLWRNLYESKETA